MTQKMKEIYKNMFDDRVRLVLQISTITPSLFFSGLLGTSKYYYRAALQLKPNKK